MPVFRDVELTLDVDRVVAHWGRRKHRLAKGRVPEIVADLIAAIETNRWLRPTMSFGIQRVVVHTERGLELKDATLTSPLLAHRLCRAQLIAAGVCTLSQPVSAEISRLFAVKEPLRAVLLDEIATIALYGLSDRLEQCLREQALHLGMEVSGMLGPGEQGFDLSQQATILQLAEAEAIGVSMTSTGMLKPAKSISMVAGLGTRMPSWDRGDNCARCNARERCPYREQTSYEARA